MQLEGGCDKQEGKKSDISTCRRFIEVSGCGNTKRRLLMSLSVLT